MKFTIGSICRQLVFTAKLHLLMRRDGISLTELSRRIGVCRATVSRWKSGERMPETDILKKLSDLFHTDLTEGALDMNRIEAPFLLSENRRRLAMIHPGGKPDEVDFRDIAPDALDMLSLFASTGEAVLPASVENWFREIPGKDDRDTDVWLRSTDNLLAPAVKVNDLVRLTVCSQVLSAGIYLVSEDGIRMLRQVVPVNGGYQVTRPEQQSRYFTDDLKVYRRVTGVLSYWNTEGSV